MKKQVKENSDLKKKVVNCSIPYDDQGEGDIVENVRAAKVRDGSSVFFASEYATAELWNNIREARNFSSPMCEQIEKVRKREKSFVVCRIFKKRGDGDRPVNQPDHPGKSWGSDLAEPK